MAEPGLTGAYLGALAASLPASIVEELADGLDQARRNYLDQGASPEQAARAAIAEFGEPKVIIEAFARASPARRAARKLLAAGPAAGGCWAAVLVTGRAWTWPVPAAARIVFGTALLTVICLLIVAAFGRSYRAAARSGGAGCAGIAALDAAMLMAVTLTGAAALGWPLALAITASAVRIGIAVRGLRTVLAG